MRKTEIEWTEATWNPVTGCTKVSQGCKNCYAERMSKRLAGRYGYPADEPFRVTLHLNRLEEPLRVRKPTTFFVCSMSDLFHKDVPTEFIDEVFAVMAMCPQHTFQVLTKRPERMQQYFRDIGGTTRRDWVFSAAGRLLNKVRLPGFDWPLPNVWLGTSVENQEEADKRIPFLLQCPAKVRFLSCEPLLGPLLLARHCRGARWEYVGGSHPSVCTECGRNPREHLRHDIHWVITGGESGPGARPMHPDWVRSLRDQCQAAGVPFFFKQLGQVEECNWQGKFFGAPYEDGICIDGYMWDLDSGGPGEPLTIGGDEPCPQCRGTGVRRFKTARGGNEALLDGKEHREMPVTP